MDNVTIYDIAEKAGVSAATVSRILNDRGAISEKTKEKVYAVIKELNYVPNQMARSLQKENHSSIIGVILPNIANPFFSDLVQRIDNSCKKRGYKMLLCTAAQETDREEDYVRILKSHGVAGVLLRSRSLSGVACDEINLPAVSLEVQIPGIPCITCDNFDGGYQAARVLIEAGSKHPLIISEDGLPNGTAMLRLNGFMKCCEDLGVCGRNIVRHREELREHNYSSVVISALETFPDTDGLFCPSDIHAACATTACLKSGRSVPEDIQIVGFDGTYISRTFSTTTIVQPLQAMTDYAIDLLIKKINGEIIPISTTLQVSVEYGSTTRPHSADTGG